MSSARVTKKYASSKLQPQRPQRAAGAHSSYSISGDNGSNRLRSKLRYSIAPRTKHPAIEASRHKQQQLQQHQPEISNAVASCCCCHCFCCSVHLLLFILCCYCWRRRRRRRRRRRCCCCCRRRRRRCCCCCCCPCRLCSPLALSCWLMLLQLLLVVVAGR